MSLVMRPASLVVAGVSLALELLTRRELHVDAVVVVAVRRSIRACVVRQWAITTAAHTHHAAASEIEIELSILVRSTKQKQQAIGKY